MSEITALEYSTLKVPYESLNKKYRSSQKIIDREISFVQQTVIDIEKSISQSNVQVKGVTRLLGNMVEKLQVLKRKATENVTEETRLTLACKKRIDHLKEHEVRTTDGSISKGSRNLWQRTRLDRMITEYLLRGGYYNTALKLAEISKIDGLTNIDLFLVAREVEKTLKNKETNKCLAWCHENRSKLRRLKSDLEFKLRMQEFIELIRKDRMMDAIKHSRKYFPAYEEEHLSSLQQVMALLAFPMNTEIECYRVLFDENRWDKLIEQFRQENYRLFQLADQSLFTCALQAGLSAMKTPHCYSNSQENRSVNCPVCLQTFNVLAEDLPFAHCSQSRLFCRISGAPLNENNRPMMLPNGFVYGENALEQMALENNGNVICPRTKEIFPYKKVERVYVM